MSSRLDCITDWGSEAELAQHRVTLLARRCGVTERQLRRYFRLKFGASPHFWITTHRLEKLRPMLASGALVKEVAAMAGFSQQGNFTRRYKQYYKVNPSASRDANG